MKLCDISMSVQILRRDWSELGSKVEGVSSKSPVSASFSDSKIMVEFVSDDIGEVDKRLAEASV